MHVGKWVPVRTDDPDVDVVDRLLDGGEAVEGVDPVALPCVSARDARQRKNTVGAPE